MKDKTRIFISFKSKNQLPWFMVIKEYYESGEVVFAKVLYEFWPTYKQWNNKGRRSK